MSRTPTRRRFDPDPPDRAALAELRMERLSMEVRQACDRFLASRNLPINLPFLDSRPREPFRPLTGPDTALETPCQRDQPPHHPRLGQSPQHPFLKPDGEPLPLGKTF